MKHSPHLNDLCKIRSPCKNMWGRSLVKKQQKQNKYDFPAIRVSWHSESFKGKTHPQVI